MIDLFSFVGRLPSQKACSHQSSRCLLNVAQTVEMRRFFCPAPNHQSTGFLTESLAFHKFCSEEYHNGSTSTRQKSWLDPEPRITWLRNVSAEKSCLSRKIAKSTFFQVLKYLRINVPFQTEAHTLESRMEQLFARSRCSFVVAFFLLFLFFVFYVLNLAPEWP